MGISDLHVREATEVCGQLYLVGFLIDELVSLLTTLSKPKRYLWFRKKTKNYPPPPRKLVGI